MCSKWSEIFQTNGIDGVLISVVRTLDDDGGNGARYEPVRAGEVDCDTYADRHQFGDHRVE